MKIKTSHVLIFLVYAIAVAFSVKSLREPDLWWQIRTGQWILENGHVPLVDTFSMTKFGTEWINIKWGFEVIAALIADTLGAESVFVMQILVSLLIFFFLRKTILKLGIDSPLSFFVAAMFTLLGIQYRMIGRPEMVSHLMQAVFLFIFLSHHSSKTKIIWWLIPLQIFWTNMHEAYGMGIVIVGVYLIAEWIWAIRSKQKKPLQLLYVFLGVISAILINPRGWILLWRPLNIFSQVQENKYTTELGGILSAEFWQFETYCMIGLVLALIGLMILHTKRSSVSTLIKRFSIGYFALLTSFLFLSFTAYRNAVFFFLWAFPLLSYLLKEHIFIKERGSYLFIFGGLAFYVLIVSNGYYTLTESRDRFGLEVLSTHNPVGATEYLQKRGLSSKKGFADYLTSSYLLWKLQPDFKTFIDLRDLDVFTNQDFDRYLQIVNKTDSFHALDQQEKFDYVVLYRLSDPYLHAYLYRDSIYACTYVDAVAAVYEKTDDFTRDDIFSPCIAVKAGFMSNLINHLMNPFYQSYDYTDLDYDFYAAEYYFSVGRLILAEQRISKYLRFHPGNVLGLELSKKIQQVMNQPRQPLES